jgi:hypothetical protein
MVQVQNVISSLPALASVNIDTTGGAGTRFAGGFYTSNNAGAFSKVTQGVFSSLDYGGVFNHVSGQTEAKFAESSQAAVFQKSGSSKTLSVCNSSYAVSNTSGQGKYYFPDGAGPFTGFHDGVTADIPELGDIMVDKEILQRIDISNVVASFEMSTTINQKGVIGICSQLFDTPPMYWGDAPTVTEYTLTPEEQAELESNPLYTPPLPTQPVEYTPVPPGHKVIHINALGEGMINVCGENGNIEKGDLIVTSSIPGKGMKQSDDIVRSYTVAKARESVTFVGNEIKQIACVYTCG